MPDSPHSPLALALAVTIRHDGHGGVADDLTDGAGLHAWVREHAEALRAAGWPGQATPAKGEAPSGEGGRKGRETGGLGADAAALAAVREVRAAVRALFARAVRPGPPSSADAHRLPPADAAIARLNAAAARVPAVTHLDWPEDGEPVLRAVRRPGASDGELLAAVLAREAIAFLAGPLREQLRSCQAPRCVRYFLKGHPRQEWCGPSCGNRARVARHQRRHRSDS